MKLKKLAAIFLSAVMAVSVTTTAFADTTEQTGSITVTGVHSAGRELVAYRLFDATTDGTNYGYTVNDAYKTELVDAVNTIVEPDISANDEQLGPKLLDAISGFDDSEAKNFALSMQNALKDEQGDATLAQDAAITAAPYKYAAEDVPLGYYIVFDKTEGSNEYAPTFAMLSPANTDATATAKDSTVTSGKSVKTDGEYANTGNVNIGDTITYKITGDIPAYASTGNDKYEVKLTDTLPDNGQLQYIGITSVELKAKDGTTLHTFDSSLVTFNNNDPSKATSFVFDELVVDKNNQIDYLSDKPATITITYTAKVVGAEKIVDSNTNTFKYEYGNPSGDLKSLEKKATVYTYGFSIYKHNESKEALAGAEFNLTKKGSTAPLTFTMNQDGNYIYDANGSATLVSGADGYVSIYGLDAGTYTLEETKAPNGYNLLADTIDVTITAKAGSDNGDCTVSYKPTHGTDTSTDAVNYTVGVENTTGTTLPGTGGMGTTLFTVGGLLILCAAGTFLFFNRKRIFGK